MDDKCRCVAGSGKGVVLRIPDAIFVKTGRNNQMVTIDPCISRVIEHLWQADIVTLGCCCAHRRGDPAVVIASFYTDDQIAKIHQTISEVNDRLWDVCQWRMVRGRMKLMTFRLEEMKTSV